jgi:hypothetical protein
VAKRKDAGGPGPRVLPVTDSEIRATVAAVEGMERWVVFPWSGREERT